MNGKIIIDELWKAMISLEGFRDNGNYEESDKLRDLLLEFGIKTKMLKDGYAFDSDGTDKDIYILILKANLIMSEENRRAERN